MTSSVTESDAFVRCNSGLINIYALTIQMTAKYLTERIILHISVIPVEDSGHFIQILIQKACSKITPSINLYIYYRTKIKNIQHIFKFSLQIGKKTFKLINYMILYNSINSI